MTITDIKKEFRAAMNGVLSARMREAGAPYKVIFGIELPRLRQIAEEVKEEITGDPRQACPNSQGDGVASCAQEDAEEQLRSLAQQLWNENIRESKLIATMLMPSSRFFPEVADIWVDEITTDEVAQVASMNLFSNLPQAASLAFEWIATNHATRQLCGYLVLARLINGPESLNERSLDELRDQMDSAKEAAPLALRKAIMAVESKISDEKV